MRVAVVMPPVTALEHDAALDSWPSVVLQATALREHAGLQVMVACRTSMAPGDVTRDGVHYRFAGSDRELAGNVRDWQPDVVHVHGLGFSRLTIRLGRALSAQQRMVLQHHGEPPGRWRTVIGHRLARRYVDGYLFTGAMFGQAQPFIDRGMISKRTPCYEVLEAASTLSSGTSSGTSSGAPAIALVGSPAVLWVGRLIESKDPLTAIAVFARAVGEGLAGAHLHLLASDRSMQVEVIAAISALGGLSQRVHLHDPVSSNAMRGWYRAAQVLLSTSRREGSGYALIEAITEGCVPVATSIPPHLAIVGELAPTFSPGDVIAAAELLVAAPMVGREAVCSYAARALSWSAVAEQLQVAYKLTRHSHK